MRWETPLCPLPPPKRGGMEAAEPHLERAHPEEPDSHRTHVARRVGWGSPPACIPGNPRRPACQWWAQSAGCVCLCCAMCSMWVGGQQGCMLERVSCLQHTSSSSKIGGQTRPQEAGSRVLGCRREPTKQALLPRGGCAPSTQLPTVPGQGGGWLALKLGCRCAQRGKTQRPGGTDGWQM